MTAVVTLPTGPNNSRYLRQRAEMAAKVIATHTHQHGYPPSVAGIAQTIGANRTRVYAYLHEAERLGLVEHRPIDRKANWWPRDGQPIICPACGRAA